jgi:hypothetical protein
MLEIKFAINHEEEMRGPRSRWIENSNQIQTGEEETVGLLGSSIKWAGHGHLNRAGETLMRELPRVAYPGSSSRLTGQEDFLGTTDKQRRENGPCRNQNEWKKEEGSEAVVFSLLF